MTNRKPRSADRWLRVLRHTGWPVLAASGLLICAPEQLTAQHGWKFGRKTATEPAAAPNPPSNGFVTAIHKLQEEAKRRAFDGDVDGAIACAQRARKIAEASSMLVSEDPECTVEAADRLVEKLMAVRATAGVPAKSPAPSSNAVAARQQPKLPPAASLHPAPAVAQAASARSVPLPPPIPSWQRPVTSFEPHPVAVQAKPVAAVALGWTPETSHADVAADWSTESIRDVVQSDERTFAYLMARAKSPQSQPNVHAADVVATDSDDWADPAPQAEPDSAQHTTADDDWSSEAPVVTPAVREEAEEPSGAGQFELLHQIQSSEPAEPEADAPESYKSPFVQPLEAQHSPQESAHTEESEVAVASANRSHESWPQGDAIADVKQANLAEEPAAPEMTSAVTPTAYSTKPVSAGLAKPHQSDTFEVELDESLRVPTVYFRDVEPLSAQPTAPSAKSAKMPPLHLAERLAKWTNLPVTTVAAGLGGLGLILLGIGLCLARTALQPNASGAPAPDESASA